MHYYLECLAQAMDSVQTTRQKIEVE